MTKKLSLEQRELLQKLYYDDNLMFGRDKLFDYIKNNHSDMKISRRMIDTWLKSQEIHTIHTRAKTIKDIKTQVVKVPHSIIQIDLANLQNLERRNFKYVMVAVDMFSRRTYIEALKDRNKKSILNAFKKIHKKIPELKVVRSDNEFTNDLYKKYLDDKNIKQVLSNPDLPQSQGQVERMNSNVKRIISKMLLYNSKFDWTKNLRVIEEAINSTINQSTKRTPNEIEKLFKEKDEEALQEIYNIQKGIKGKQNRLAKQIVNVGDFVRIFEPNDKFKSRKWSKEIYEVEKVNKPKTEYGTFTYKLKDDKAVYKNEEILKIEGQENRVSLPDTYEISKLVKAVIKNNTPHYEVKWKNYRETTFEPRDDLLEDVPKLLNSFEKKNKIRFEKYNNKWNVYYDT